MSLDFGLVGRWQNALHVLNISNPSAVAGYCLSRRALAATLHPLLMQVTKENMLVLAVNVLAVECLLLIVFLALEYGVYLMVF